MIVVAGGTGRLGTNVVTLLRRQGQEVRVLTHNRSRAAHLAGTGIEIVDGDVRDFEAVRRAVTGAQTVVSAIQGFAGTKDGTPATIDGGGNRNLIVAAQEAGVENFVLVSVKDASPNHPAELMRMKYTTEQELKAGGLAWTIIRPTAYMETWCDVLGRPLLDKGKTQVFGRGINPINWVSASDVAEFVALAATDPAMRGQLIEVGGPENLTMTAFVEVFRRETGSTGSIGHIPPAAMRAMGVVMGLANRGMARQIQMSLIMDTLPQAFDASETRLRFPSIPVTNLTQVVKRDYAEARGAAQRPNPAVRPQ